MIHHVDSGCRCDGCQSRELVIETVAAYKAGTIDFETTCDYISMLTEIILDTVGGDYENRN
jgi:hypothetical protein